MSLIFLKAAQSDLDVAYNEDYDKLKIQSGDSFYLYNENHVFNELKLHQVTSEDVQKLIPQYHKDYFY